MTVAVHGKLPGNLRFSKQVVDAAEYFSKYE